MNAMTEADIRAAIRNCSRGERKTMTLPRLDEMDWADLEYLGWRDAKAPLRGYLVQSTPQGARGIALRAPESRVRRMAQCLLCHSVRRDAIALFSAPRGGAAGRNGNTLGTYMCAELDCSRYMRAALRPSRELPNPSPVIAVRAQELARRLDAFISSVLGN